MSDTLLPNPRAVTDQIAAALGETEAGPRQQIWRIVRFCGPEQALAWLEEAQALEAAGGMMTANGERRRTPGGAYFALVRQALYMAGRKADIARIFWQQPGKRAAARGSREGSAAPVPAVSERASWDEREAWVAEARAAPGKATSVKVTIIGRPGRVVEREGFVLFQLTHEGPLPALPKGLPVPSAMPATTYAVYVNAKQWRGVAEAMTAPDDALIIEGVQWYDREFEAIVVMATRTTTKALQRANRAPPPAPPTPGT